MSDPIEIPLGRSESQRLEFKGAAALKRPERIGREVAAMLNSGGGEVWIGLGEEGSRAVRIEPIPRADREAKRLLDFLLDSLSPPVSAREVVVETVPADSTQGQSTGREVIRIVVTPDPSKRPYALTSSSGWLFVERVQDRLRPMTRDEVFGGAAKRVDESEEAVGQVLAERRQAQEDRHPRLWIAVQPAGHLALEIGGSFYDELNQLLEDPLRTGNRRSGWHFALSSDRPRLSSGQIDWGLSNPELDVRQSARIIESGGLRFEVSLRRLRHKGEPDELWPVPLFEYPASAFRIASKIYQEKVEEGRTVVADLALFEARSSKLRPGAPGPFWSTDDAAVFDEAPDLLSDHPLVFTAGEVIENPDRCAFRLVRRVYEAFGLRQDAILPGVYDPAAGRLVLED